MAKTTNITKYTCAPLPRQRIPHRRRSRTSSDWHQIKHTTADGVTQEELACTSCQQEFKKLAATQDARLHGMAYRGKGLT